MAGTMRVVPRAEVDFRPLRSLGYLLGKPPDREVVSRFESAMEARYPGLYAVAMPHARIGVYEMLLAMEIRPGMEVLLTPVTIPDVVNAILLAGLRPVFVDLGLRSCSMDLEAMSAATNARTCGILVTHLAGFPADMDHIASFARARGLFLIEDFSQAHGAFWNGSPLGTFGDGSVCSLTTLKPLCSFHGGLALVRDPRIARTLRRVSDSWATERWSTLLGWWIRDSILKVATEPLLFGHLVHPAIRRLERTRPSAVRRAQIGAFGPWKNYDDTIARRESFPEGMFRRYSGVQAAIALHLLKDLDQRLNRRRDLGNRLLRSLQDAGVVGLPKVPPGANPGFWRLPWWPRNRTAAAVRLAQLGVDAVPTNLPCVSREPAFQEFRVFCPNAESYCDDMLYLPLHSCMSDQDLERVVHAVASVDRSP